MLEGHGIFFLCGILAPVLKKNLGFSIIVCYSYGVLISAPMVVYGQNFGITILQTICCLQNAAYTVINVRMQLGSEATEFAADRGLFRSKKTPHLTNIEFHVKFIRLYFFTLFAFNTASTYMLFHAYDICARPIAAVFASLHIGVLIIDWNVREVPIHTFFATFFIVGGILAFV